MDNPIFEWDEEEVKSEVRDEETHPKKKNEVTEEVEDFNFGDEEETEESEEESEEETDEESGEESGEETDEEEEEIELPDTVKTILEDFVSLGMASADEVKDVDIDNFYDLIDTIANKRADSIIESSVAELQPTEKQAVDFLLNGGKVTDLVGKFSTKTYDVSTENGALAFLRDYYKGTGLDDDDIQEMLDGHEEKENTIKIADKYHKLWEKSKNANVEEELNKPSEAKADREAKTKEWKNTLITSARKVEEYAGITFTPDKKKDLINDIVLNTVKTEDGKYTSRFIHEFFKVYNSDPKKLLFIASVLQDDFDPEKFAATLETKETKKVKSKLRTLTTKKEKKKVAAKQPRSIAELF